MKINIGVFFGGRSVEHEVAIISAVQAMNNIDQTRYDITPIYISKTGEMYYSPLMIDINEFKNIDALVAKSMSVSVIKQGEKVNLIQLKKGLFKKQICSIDIAFPIVHGTNCEDGALVGWFELLGLPYISCDVKSAAVGMDKEIFKYVLMQNEIPVLPCVSFYSKEWMLKKEEILEKISTRFEFPLIIKPVNLGSSVGISKASTKEELIDSINEAMNYSERILVEKAIKNLKEFNCSVLGDIDTQECSEIEEPVMSGEILTYDDKYKGNSGKGGTKDGSKSSGMASLKRKIPADLEEETRNQIIDYASRTFAALGCNGVVRIDFLFDCDTKNVYVNEINTIPGSLSFYLWEPKGVKYSTLIDKLIDLGFKRKRAKENLSFSFETNILAQGGSFGSKGKK